MTEQEIERFHDSFDRCTSRPDFFDLFHREFLASSSEVADLFRNVDVPKQKRLLKASLYITVQAATSDDLALPYLEQLAMRHLDLKVKPRHFDLWHKTLIKLVRLADPCFDPAVGHAWEAVLASGIAIMKRSTRRL